MKSFKHILFKIFKITGITVVSILLLMFLVPFLFPKTITKKVSHWANKNINGHIHFKDASLSFFTHFPALTLTLNDFVLKGSAPFQKDTLIGAKEIALGIDISSVFKDRIGIDKIYLSNALINIQVDSSGKANYNVYKPAAKNDKASADTSEASLGINQILVQKSLLVYNDRSLPMKINARDFNYTGSGDLSKDIFDLHTHAEIGSLDFYYGNQPYIISKKVNADLVTQMNTKSLAFIFSKNNLSINKLPVQFTGKFEFLKDGYAMDFKVASNETKLRDIFTAIPAAYQKMLEKTDVDGTGLMQVYLKGNYIASKKQMPDFGMNLKVRNGYVNNQKSPAPIRNLYLNLETKLPGLNVDSLSVKLDSIYFNIGKDYFSSVVKIKGVKNPYIYAKINSEIDLEKWTQAMGVKPYTLKGQYSLHLLAEGKYATGTVKSGLRKIDTVITSIPKFTLRSSFKDGYFKYNSLYQAINQINFNLQANCPDNNYKHVNMVMDNINVLALSNYIKGYFKLSNMDNIDADLKAKFHLTDLKKFYPIDSIELKGDLIGDMRAKGKYFPAKKQFPVVVANVSMHNGSIKTKYYPHPIQNIEVNTNIVNRTGTLAGMKVIIKPISFRFENEPFTLKANLNNFADLEYDMTAQGILNIGKIYKVFAIKGYNVNGLVAANFTLKGKQSDAVAGHYDKLSNSGTLKVDHIALTSELFPKPFLINKGEFSFNQDKMLFDNFTADYGKSDFTLNGSLSNVLDYVVKPGSVLKGEFNMKSALLVADDFMAFSGSPQSAQVSSSSKGVIMVPRNLNLTFAADVDKLSYNGLILQKAKGQMTVNNGNINLKQTGFTLIGAPVAMDANYTNNGPQKAYFDYHINAKDFDIKKAYNKIKIFHDMATSAEHAEGLVSLDYKLSGRLNNDMQPVYSSIKGGGTLSAKQIKMRGFKLMGAIGSSTKHDSIAQNSDVSQVAIKTTIANNIITIERTKLRMAGFRARFEGQVSFDKAMNINFRLGLPPLGIIGIPLNITGTQDNPKIHLGKSKKEDELQAVDDTDN